MSIAYLGPPGTFSEQAARAVARDDEPLVAHRDVAAALEAVTSGTVDRAVVPIENAIQGSVTATLDALAADDRLRIRGELELAIDLVLAGRPGLTVETVREVRSHPVPLAGCARWLSDHLPTAERVASSSTARAAQDAAVDDGVAAIVNPLAVATYGLEVLARDVADTRGNVTRFVVVGQGIPARTGFDKTSVLVFIHTDQPGALLRLLEVFAERELNLTKIESRPTRHELGDYCFFLDVEGHVGDERVGDALAAVRRTQRAVTLLGSYRRSGAREPTATSSRVAADDARYTAARSWLAALRDEVEPG